MSFDIEDYLDGRDPHETLTFKYVSIKLKSGETIFTSVADLNDDNYCVMVPLKVTSVPYNGSYVSALIEFLVGTDDIFSVLPKEHCLMISQLSDASIMEYKKGVKKILGSVETLTEDDKQLLTGEE